MSAMKTGNGSPGSLSRSTKTSKTHSLKFTNRNVKMRISGFRESDVLELFLDEQFIHPPGTTEQSISDCNANQTTRSNKPDTTV